MKEIRTLAVVWLALIALLALTIAASYALSGTPSLMASLGIAAVKAALIYWFFMKLREERGAVRLVALGVLVWLAIMFVLSGTDYFTR
jgi:cytochrome c oxidase subunit 4